ncbi:methyl-accepting chemotaxis protein [Pelomonas sp. CA6]|uniref:methyl-accepting chemotaxis protein n=1 Tax=Pelomonas sp. CA6 TaxID=2907999 RepID=UPI001F4C4462|nr:PAS domain-containing methyl-accepting chemotaxis protein [Pelomonas sp. CA6]MCH7345360.1 methyl-accepting chemotaxis protein [Pelomonas sp. CA6]
MRINNPVTQREFPFPPGQTLVSVTDPKGRIVYCNAAFVEVSGYARSELLGQPHNLVRHPDMPEEAFRDLWATIAEGRPWAGLVKNRRKDGDHYWVMANATPVRREGRTVGYLSVRTAPTRAQVEQADRLYARMRKEAEQGRPLTRLRHGRVVRGDLSGRLGQWLTGGLAGLGSSGALMLTAAIAAAALGSALPWLSWLPLVLLLGLSAHALQRRAADRRLAQLLDNALQLAGGDLSRELPVESSGLIGELQLALRQLSVNLKTVIGDVAAETRHLREAVSEISSGNQDLSSRTESQAGSVQQTAASIEQIHGTVKQSAASAQQGVRLADQAASTAKEGNEAVDGVVHAMESISDSSRRIGEITHVIETVAFQTNILALNAAIEAARAGEAGRGFAVVAGEVRALASRTAGAAREIKQLIAEAGERVEAGNRQTLAAQERMHQVLQSFGRVSQLLTQVHAAASEQQDGVAQVNSAVAHIDSITQQNAAMVEELAASAQALNSQVGNVTETLQLFRLDPAQPSIAERDAVQMRRDGVQPGLT